MSLNKVMLIGNVGKDPEVRYLESNPAQQGPAPKVASFPLATSERYKDRNGNLQENTEWHNVVVWRGLADTVEKFVKKGTQLYVEGKLKTRSWTDQSGAKRYTTEVVADVIQLLGKRSDNPAASGYAAPGGTEWRIPAAGTGLYAATAGLCPAVPGLRTACIPAAGSPACRS